MHCALLGESNAATVKIIVSSWEEACFVADSAGLHPLQAAIILRDAHLSAAFCALQQELEQLPLSALRSRAETAGRWPEDVATGSREEEERLELLDFLMESRRSELTMRHTNSRLDDVVTALSDVVDVYARSHAKALHPEAYVGPTSGKLGGGGEGISEHCTLLDAMTRCTALTWSVGFTFQGPPDPSPTEKLDCIFFPTLRRSGIGDEMWTTFVKQVDSRSMTRWRPS